MKRMMSWTPTPSHLMKQMPRKRGPRHKGLESTKWNDEISYLGSEKLMSFWAIFLVLHFASLICGNPLFGCYKGGEHPNIYPPIQWLHLNSHASSTGTVVAMVLTAWTWPFFSKVHNKMSGICGCSG